MTALRFLKTADPINSRGRILPMDKIDAEFWRLRRERKDKERTHG